MADNVTEQSATTEQPAAQTEAQIQLAQQMAIALNGGIPPDLQQQAAATTEVAAAAAAQAQPAAPVDYFGTIKEKFGYQTHEDAIAEIEQLRAFKATPPVKELEFENEESRRFFEAAVRGDRKIVYETLHKEHQLDRHLTGEVTAESATDIVKLGMQLKYKDLSVAEIDYKFKKTFAVPPKPVQSDVEDETDYNSRLSAWQEIADDKAMELLIEAKLAKPELELAKSKLVFPEIVQNEDDGYVQYKKALEQQPALQAEQEKRNAEAIAAYQAFTPKSIETKLNFTDEANKINFDFTFEPDQESFAQTQAMVKDTESFFNSFNDKDGNPDRKAFLEAVYFAKNRVKIILEAINQGKNAAVRATLPDNSQGGLVRQMANVQEPSELHKQMQQAGIVQ